MSTSPDLSGGKGFSFEDVAVAEYLLALLANETAPGLSGYIVTLVQQQRAAFGQPLDDLIIDAVSPTANKMCLCLQAKSSLTVSAAKTNNNFREVIAKCWDTVSKPEFQNDRDRVGVIVGTIADTTRRAVADVTEWARASVDSQSFLSRFQAKGFADDDKRGVIESVRSVLPGASDDDIYLLLRHFVIVKLDVLHVGSTDEAASITLARRTLDASASSEAESLWTALKQIARDGAGVAAQTSRASLLSDLSGRFRFDVAPALKVAVERLSDEAKLSLGDISNEIDGVSINRPKLRNKFEEALAKHRFVQIVGIPGTGKSAILLTIAQSCYSNGNLLALKSDRVTSTSWHAYAQSIGLPSLSVENLLIEIGATGTPILFIDGLDRFTPSNKGVALDLIKTISESPALKHWKIVASLRDNGIEPVRTWLPPSLFKDLGVATVEVGPFDDEEAQTLATAQPSLQPLLFGSGRVKEIARRPFFASVLIRSLATGDKALSPKSEVELIEAWWSRGGYNATGGSEVERQRALLSLALKAGPSLGGNISVESVEASPIQTLISDGVIRWAKSGHAVRFRHDIFFEWAFFHLLVERGGSWPDVIVSMGELPGLARAVELLSQSEFVSTDTWEDTLRRLEEARLRSQWQRAWLLAPFGTPAFLDKVSVFNAAVGKSEKRLSQTIVWHQAEKTTPNPNVLAMSKAANESSRSVMLRSADVLAWPSDISSWRRFCYWLLQRAPDLPISVIPDAVTALSVWQNIASNSPNQLSSAIFRQFLKWLQSLEDQIHSREFKWNPEGWNQLSSAELSELEGALRSEIFRSVNVEREGVSAYLKRLAKRRWIRDSAFDSVKAFAGMLAHVVPDDLAEVTKAELLNDLPETIVNRPVERSGGMLIPHSMGFHDWQSLSIHDRHGFFPDSPLREPFHSMLRFANSQALELTYELSNHAITAWIQLHKYDHQRRGIPLPLVIDLPWGRQEFFGDHQVYCWSRGHWGPHAVECALMALDDWAFERLDAGDNIDQLIETVVKGHKSVAILAVAVALALAANRITPTVLALAGAQRLWGYDFARAQQDGPNQANLIGFTDKSDLPHYEAVKKGNDRKIRTLDIRWLAQIAMLDADDGVRESIQRALQSFPSDLPYEYQEQVGQPEIESALKKRAEDWAVIGDPKNYHAEKHPSGEGIIVTVKHPRENDPDVVEARKKATQFYRELTLANWAEKAAREGVLPDSLTIDAAIALAKAFDRKNLFVSYPEDEGVELARGAVAGAAATVLVHGNALTVANAKWATSIILRAAKTSEVPSDYSFAEQTPLYHPVGYAIRGLGEMIRTGIEGDKAKNALLELVAHDQEAITALALREAFACWSASKNFVWSALNLAIIHSTGRHKDAKLTAYGYDFTQPSKTTRSLIAKAKRNAASQRPLTALETIPATWQIVNRTPKNTKGFRRIYTDAKTGELWSEPDTFFRWDFLGRVLEAVPVEQILKDSLRSPAFLNFSHALLQWTIQRLMPPWERAREDRDDLGREPFKWKHTVMRFLADVALNQSAEETDRDILAPIYALDDDHAADLLEPFVNLIVCKGILDPKEVIPQTIPVLTHCVERILKSHDWENARQRDGDIYGHYLPYMIKDFLMIPVEQANLSARFANGDWSQIELAMPVIDPFVKATGDVPSVTYMFLTLCERAKEHYPAARFVEQVEAFLAHQNGMPVGWRGTMIPGRIAALIQGFAEAGHPLQLKLGQAMLRILDRLVDLGDRRSAALQSSELFRSIRT